MTIERLSVTDEQLQKLIKYFEKRAEENQRRTLSDEAQWFAGKADSYRNAARKVRELLNKEKP